MAQLFRHVGSRHVGGHAHGVGESSGFGKKRNFSLNEC